MGRRPASSIGRDIARSVLKQSGVIMVSHSRARWSALLCATALPPLVSAADPVATSDGERPGVTLQIQELKVSNGAAILKLTVVNNSANAFHSPDLRGDANDYNSVAGIYLIDSVNKKKYLVMYDTEKQCVCSRQVEDIPAKASANYWAKFQAPPDGVQKIGVVVPHFQPLENVPVSR
jgi:hypothetical protein